MRPLTLLALALAVWPRTHSALAQDIRDFQTLPVSEFRAHNSLDNEGGPDDFGYVFLDNQTGDSATFDWIELDNDPEAFSLEFSSRDDGYSPAVAFTNGFPFYGVVQDSFRITTNGTIQFTTHSTAYDNY